MKKRFEVIVSMKGKEEKRIIIKADSHIKANSIALKTLKRKQKVDSIHSRELKIINNAFK